MKKPKTMLDHALALAALGFRVIPVTPFKKQKPLRKRFWAHASRLEERVRRLWKKRPTANPAISTSRFRDGALLVIDIDPKHGGPNTLEGLKLIMGYEFPDTYEQHTPSGGTHLVYYVPHACAGLCGKDGLGPGLDVRSHHNYILGAGAQTAAGVYTNVIRPVVQAPDWLLAWAAAHPPAKGRAPAVETAAQVDRRKAISRAVKHLQSLPPAPEGYRDGLAYKAACKLRGYGLSQSDTADLMVSFFKYQGNFTEAEIEHAADSAFKYAKGEAGEEAPVDAGGYFSPIEPEEAPESASLPRETASTDDTPETSGDLRHVLNQSYAAVMVGGKFRVMWMTTDKDGKPRREFLTIEDFKAKEAGNMMQRTAVNADGHTVDAKPVELSTAWLRWKHRQSYDGLVFAPGQKLSPRFYNTWRGLAYEPLARGEKPTDKMRKALDMFLTHIRENYCAGNAGHAKWVLGTFAHLIQRPQEKTRVAVVAKGGRGSGKTTVANMVGALVEPHFFSAPDLRYLLGNFNAHMAETLLFVLEEAVWGGSKTAESMLKDVVTSGKINVEQKFREAFRVDNYMRIMIIGNEKWQVPAALKDERRWAVFDVEMRSMPFETEEHKTKVRRWFDKLYRLMKNGGYRYLLTYLQGVDLAEVDVNTAPVTKGLVEQIHHTLPPLLQWWRECLQDGSIVYGDFQGWPRDAEKARMFDAFTRYCDNHRIDSRRPGMIAFGRELHEVCKRMQLDKKKWVDGQQSWIYRLPPLSVARREWAKAIGRAPAWPDDVEI